MRELKSTRHVGVGVCVCTSEVEVEIARAAEFKVAIVTNLGLVVFVSSLSVAFKCSAGC